MDFGSKLSKLCIPNPGIALNLSGPNGDVDMFICYECQAIEVVRPKQTKILAWADFDKVAGPMLSFAKQVFPNDKLIQDLRLLPNGMIGSGGRTRTDDPAGMNRML